MNGTNQIPSLELNLPVTGYVVVMAQALTVGQFRSIQMLLFESSKFNTTTSAFEDTNMVTYMKTQDKAAEFLILEIRDKEGNPQPLTPEWLGNLPIEDGNLIYGEINKVVSKSTLSKEDQKK